MGKEPIYDIELTKEPFVIGRDSTCDYVVSPEYSEVSRFHCKIATLPVGYIEGIDDAYHLMTHRLCVVDLSANGTWLFDAHLPRYHAYPLYGYSVFELNLAHVLTLRISNRR